jgi:enoyl-CoA hydratase
MAGTEHLTVRREGATLVLTLNRPDAKNALSLSMLVGLYDGWVEADADDDIRSIVLTGAGGAFCAGMDLKALAGKGMAGEHLRDRLKADPDLHWKAMLRHHRPRKPVITAVEGYCVAGGTEILQGTDIRVAGESATFGLFEVRRGLFPYTAREAADIGLIGHVVPDGTALAKALEIAEQINACGPLAVEAVKASVYDTAEMTEADGLAAELKRGWPIFDTADAKEGARAFAQKRPPEYKRA